MRRTTDRGLLALVRHEGVVPAPYLDVKGVWTFGIGHTAAAGAPDPARMPRGMPADLDAGIAQAFRLFRADLARYEAEVLRAVTVPLAAHEFDALVSFHYNTGAIARAALTRALNAGDRAAAGAAFMNWLRPARCAPGARPSATSSGTAATPRVRSRSGPRTRRPGRLLASRCGGSREPEALALLRPPPSRRARAAVAAGATARGRLARRAPASLTATFSRS